MNDLPVTAPSTTDDININNAVQPQVSYGGSKESEGVIVSQELPVQPAVLEYDLPKEVETVGVSKTPTTVSLPQIAQQQGVESVGHNVPLTPTSGASITLPLTEEQIQNAMKTSSKKSIRWLAEWCVYQVRKVWNHV
jgi:hypothetical protein